MSVGLAKTFVYDFTLLKYKQLFRKVIPHLFKCIKIDR